MRAKNALLGLTVALAACLSQAPTEPAPPTRSFGLDSSWWRMSAAGAPGSADWLTSHARAPGDMASILARHDFPFPMLHRGGPDVALDWQYWLDTPTNVTPVVVTAGATPSNANDRLVATGNRGGLDYLGAGNNLYCQDTSLPCPNVAWAIPIDSAVDGSSLTLSIDGSVAYAVSSGGNVWAFTIANGNVNAGFPVAVGARVSWSSPWLDFNATPLALYVADLSGHVTKIDANTGAVLWKNTATGCPAFHSSPMVWNNVVWVGCDNGSLYRFNPATGAQYRPATSLCATMPCTAADAIWSGPFVDTINQRLVLGVRNRVIQINVNPAGGCTTGGVSCPFVGNALVAGAAAIFYSSLFVDVQGGYLYAAYDNRLWRTAYTAAGGMTNAFVSANLTGTNANRGYPKSGPMVFNGHIWLGDGGGYVSRFSSASFRLENVTPRYGTTIDSTPLIDYLGGNIYYGTNGAGNGGTPVDGTLGSWVQLAQTW